MLGAIAGDTIGSIYEFANIKTTEFPLFSRESTYTDDSVLTIAIADAILTDGDYAAALKRLGRRYPNPYGAYGPGFSAWLFSDTMGPYNSMGNGSAMRVSAAGWAFDTLEETLKEAGLTAEPTHNHPEGIAGAQATAAAIWMARHGASKDEIRLEIEGRFGYDLSESIDSIRPHYRWDSVCAGTVPPAIRAVLDGNDYEDAVRLVVSIGGDSDTLGSITGGIAEALFGGVPGPIAKETLSRLPADLREITDRFTARYCTR